MADVETPENTEEAAPSLEQTAQEESMPPQSDAVASNGTPAESNEAETPVEDPKPTEESSADGGGGDAGDDEDDDDKGSEDDRKLFVGGLSWETQEKGLKDYMSQYGEIQSCIVKTDTNTGRSRGFGFVVFNEIAGLEKALEARPHKVDDREIDSKKAEPQRREGKLFVGGVKPETEEKVIMEYFSQFGKIVKIDRPLDGRKKPKGFCFITFSKDGPISKIIKKRYHQLDNKEVECKYADPPHEGGGGGGGRGRGRGRGQSQFNSQMQWFGGGYAPAYPYGGGGYGGGPGYGSVGGYGGGFGGYGGGGGGGSGGMYGGAGGYGYGHPSGYGKARGGRHQNNYKPY